MLYKTTVSRLKGRSNLFAPEIFDVTESSLTLFRCFILFTFPLKPLVVVEITAEPVSTLHISLTKLTAHGTRVRFFQTDLFSNCA